MAVFLKGMVFLTHRICNVLSFFKKVFLEKNKIEIILLIVGISNIKPIFKILSSLILRGLISSISL